MSDLLSPVKHLIASMSEKDQASTLAACNHWMRDPMDAMEIMFEGDLHGPYSTANLILISLGMLKDDWGEE